MTSSSRPNIPSSRATISTINIATFNARSIRNKVDEVSYFAINSSIHILAITESWLGATVNDTSVKLTGFQTPFRRDRNENGGVCIYISNQLSGKRRRDLEQPDLELLWIEIYSISHRPLLLGCCYRPPNSTMEFFWKTGSCPRLCCRQRHTVAGRF